MSTVSSAIIKYKQTLASREFDGCKGWQQLLGKHVTNESENQNKGSPLETF